MGNFVDQINESAQNLDSKEAMLGKGLNIPFNSTNSGSRKIMASVQQSHSMVLSHGEVPYCATGYENRFGDRSSSIIESDTNYEVIAKVSRFSYAPNHHYYLILKDIDKNRLVLCERVSYEYRTECYGYLYNNSVMDSYAMKGAVIPKGTIMRRSTGFDQAGNRTNGSNINVAYMALDQNMEDSVIISDICSKKLSAPLIRQVEIILNENDIPLNIYGDDDVYKIFPDIGEDVKDGILMVYRREKREDAIFTQSVQRLQQIMMSDDKITIKGRVIDIEINCNNIEHISKSIYNQQFYSYYMDRIRMCNEIIEAVGPYVAQGYDIDYHLKKLYSRSISEVNGAKFVNKKLFSNIRIVFTIIDERPLEVGDKVSDRYGGKGVVSKIVPSSLMPKMANGIPVEMIKNSSTMYNRENAGQIFELEINYISMRILDHIRNPGDGTLFDPESAMDMILKFLEIQSPELHKDVSRFIRTLSYEDFVYFVESYLSKECIPYANKPISEVMTIDKLGQLYEEFPWIQQTPLKVPIVDSRGQYRFCNTRRPMVAAPVYTVRLKQFAEEKFSAAALSSTNIKNENAKSKASKNYREPNSNTPIKFGQMESGDLDHIGTEYVVANLMLHSLSPHGRRLVEQVMVGDPYNVDVKLDSRAANRSAEILQTRLKTMGYRFVFEKKKKIVHTAAVVPAIEFLGYDPKNLPPAIEFVEDGYDIDHWYKTLDEIKEIRSKRAISIDAVTFIDAGDK